MNIPGSWQTVLIVSLLVFLALGTLAVALEKPVKRWAARRDRHVRRNRLDPWNAAVVKRSRFYTSHWSAAVGRAYRS